jgi:hypothetical protein
MLGPWVQRFFDLTAQEARLLFIDGQLLRAGLSAPDIHPDANDLADSNSAIRDYAESLLLRQRIPHDPENGAEVLKRAWSYGLESDIGTTVRTSVIVGFEQGLGTHNAWVGRSAVPDFRTAQILYGAVAPELKEVTVGPLDLAELQGASESATLRSFGRILQIGRRALLANSLDEVLASAQSFGVAASLLEADLSYAVLAANAALSDNIALFYADHGNLASTGSPDATGISAALALLRAQTDEAGRYLSLPCAAILTPPAKEGTALAAVTSMWGTDPARPKVIGDARLTAGDAWYLVTLPTTRPAVRVITLRGAGQPSVSMGRIAGFDGASAKIRHDCVAVGVDYRGCIKTPLS